jgi:hypothetical protein
MAKYMLAVHADSDDRREPMTQEEMRRGYEKVAGLEAEMNAAGAFVYGARLDDAEHARVVRPASRRVRTTDGPYAETKEHMGGFYIIEAGDLEAALGWAEKVTLAIDTPIEVRLLTGVTGED